MIFLAIISIIIGVLILYLLNKYPCEEFSVELPNYGMLITGLSLIALGIVILFRSI